MSVSVSVVAANAASANAVVDDVVDVAVLLLPNADIKHNVDEPHISNFFAPIKRAKTTCTEKPPATYHRARQTLVRIRVP